MGSSEMCIEHEKHNAEKAEQAEQVTWDETQHVLGVPANGFTVKDRIEENARSGSIRIPRCMRSWWYHGSEYRDGCGLDLEILLLKL